MTKIKDIPEQEPLTQRELYDLRRRIDMWKTFWMIMSVVKVVATWITIVAVGASTLLEPVRSAAAHFFGGK